MSIDPNKTGSRVDGRRYGELSDAHRTTLVVGMMDMLDLLERYIDTETRPAFDPILKYAESFESGDLRHALDSYVAVDPATSEKCAIASNFLAMLINQSGSTLSTRGKTRPSLLSRIFSRVKTRA